MTQAADGTCAIRGSLETEQAKLVGLAKVRAVLSPDHGMTS
jgi:hypothetical protein